MFIKRTLAAGGFVLASVAAASAADLPVYGGRTGRASSGTGLPVGLDPMSAHLVDSHSDLLATPVSKQASIS